MFITGFSALLVQVIFMREFLNVFSGNELIVGVILANWMLLTASGAKIGGRITRPASGISRIVFAQVLIAILAPLSVLAIYWLKARWFQPGTLPSFYSSVLMSLLVMAPFCLLSGALFPFLSKEISVLAKKQKAQVVYGIEAAGSLIGGLLFTFFLINYLHNVDVIIFVSAINLLAAIVLANSFNYALSARIGLVVLMTIILGMSSMLDFTMISKGWIFKNQEIILSRDTPFGNLSITRTGDQYNFFENGQSLFSSDDLISNEESVHYAMIQHDDPKSVLVVSGDIYGILGEINKYKVASIDYVELNLDLVTILTNSLRMDDELANIHVGDARRFIEDADKSWDVILLNLPPPANLGVNRFYSAEFFQRLKRALNPGGVVSIPITGGSNYLSKDALQLLSIIHQTMKSVFSNVMVYSGQHNFLLASDDSIHLDVSARITQAGIENEFVNQYYIDDDQLKRRSEFIMKDLDQEAGLNTDLHPIAFFSQINYWLSWYGEKMWWILGVLVAGLMILFVLINPINKALLVTGFTASTLELVILMMFQIYFGQLYQTLALLIAGFMAGLAAGTWIVDKKFPILQKKWLILNQAIIGLLAISPLLLILVAGENVLPYFSIQVLLFVLLIFGGIFTGIQFSFAMVLQKQAGQGMVSSAYAADLLGAAGGALLVSALLVPVLGMYTTLFLVAGLNVVVVLVLQTGKKVTG